MLAPCRPYAKFLPLAILLAALAALWASGVAGQINWATLGRYQAALGASIARHPIASPALYAAIYAAVTALSVPEAAVITVAGGLLFGTALGGAMAVIGATAGAVVLFLAARYAFADLAARGGTRLARIRPGSSATASLPVGDPAGAGLSVLAGQPGRGGVRHAAAAVRRRHADRHHPGTLVYASVGAGLAGVLAAGGAPDFAVVFSPHVLLPLVGLAVLALLPVAWRRRKCRDA